MQNLLLAAFVLIMCTYKIANLCFRCFQEEKEERDDEVEIARKRGWDEYTDEHKRGEGNRHNMGWHDLTEITLSLLWFLES